MKLSIVCAFLFGSIAFSQYSLAEAPPQLLRVMWIDPGTPNAGLAWFESEDLGAGLGSGLHASLSLGTWVRLDTGEEVDSFRNDPANGPEFSKSYEKEVAANPGIEFQSRKISFEMTEGKLSLNSKKKASWSWQSKTKKKSDGLYSIRAVVKDGETKRVIKVIDVQGGAGELTSYWSPDGKYVGIYTKDSSDTNMHLAATHGPTVELLVNKGISDKAIQAATEALRKNGFNLIKSISFSKKARDKSVVFAKSSFIGEAKRIADNLIGGANHEQLTWPSDAELVVALGQSGEVETKKK